MASVIVRHYGIYQAGTYDAEHGEHKRVLQIDTPVLIDRRKEEVPRRRNKTGDELLACRVAPLPQETFERTVDEFEASCEVDGTDLDDGESDPEGCAEREGGELRGDAAEEAKDRNDAGFVVGVVRQDAGEGVKDLGG